MTATAGARRLRSVVGPYTALRLMGQGAEFIGFVVLARRLAPAAFGQLTIAFLVCRYAGVVGDWGALTRGARDVAAGGRHGSIRTYVHRRERATLVAGAVAAIGLMAAGHGRLLAMVAVALNIGLSRDWIALGRERGARAAAPTAVQGALVLGCSLLAHGLVGATLAVGVGYGAALLVSVSINRLPAEVGADRGLGPDAWILLAYLAVQVTSTIDAPLLGALDGAASAGIYGAIYRLPNAWLALLTALIGGALPTFTRAEAQGPEAMLELRRRALRLGSGAALLMLALAPAAYFSVPLLFGHEYDRGQWPIVVLIVANAVITLSAPLHVLAVVRGDDRRYAEIVGAGAVLNVALNLVLIRRHGIVGAAVATLLAQVLIAALLSAACRRPARSSRPTVGPATGPLPDLGP